ncbi:YHYH domain containing protein [Candidatus Nanopelagicaceae bacterium]
MKRTLPFALIASLIAFFALTDSQSWAETVATKSKVCPVAAFPDLSQSAGAGASYAKPALSVSCSATELKVVSNGMVSFAFEPKTPNALSAQEWSWSVPLNPVKAKSVTSIKNVLGTLGFTVSGLPIYGPTEGPMPTAEAYGDPVYNKIMDTCGGHTGPAREYHHHAITLVQQCNLSKQKILGYALDGFPIYTTLGCLNAKCTKTAVMKSGYVKTGDPKTNSWAAYTYKASKSTSALDACNGRTQPDGTYGYHVTTDFPYIIGCFAGTATLPKGRAGGPMPPMGGPGQPMNGQAPPMGGPPKP